LLAGHAQTSWYAILYTVAWTAFWGTIRTAGLRPWKLVFSSLLNLVAAGLLAVGISAVQLIPTAEYFLLSQRATEFGYQEAMTYSFWPWRFITLITPDLFGNPGKGNYWGYGNYWEDAIYIGLVPICLAVGFLIKRLFQAIKIKNDAGDEDHIKGQLTGFLFAFVIISFILALGKNTFIFPFLYEHIPTFNLFQAPTRFTIWAEFSLALMAGFGVDLIRKPKEKGSYITRLIAVGCLAVAIGAILAHIFLPNVETTFITPFIKAGLLGLGFILLILYLPGDKEGLKHMIWSWAMIGLVGFDLISVGWKLNPGIERDFYRRMDGNEFEGRIYMSGDLEYDLKFNRFFLFNSFEPKLEWSKMKDYYLPNLNMLDRKAMVNNFDPMLHSSYQLWMKELNKIELTDHPELAEIMAIGGIVNWDIEGSIELHNISEKVDYVRLYDCKLSENMEGDPFELIFDKGISLERTLLIEDSNDTDILCNRTSPGTYSIISKEPGYLRLDVDLLENAWIFWTQQWYPGWIGSIDGKKTMIKRADILFQAIYCPAGKHTVEFDYRPISFFWGSAISGMSIIVLIAGYAVSRRKRNQEG
jgi:hypothetical protein